MNIPDANIAPRSYTPDWIKGDEAAVYRQKVWDAVAKELEKAEPGIVDRVLQG